MISYSVAKPVRLTLVY